MSHSKRGSVGAFWGAVSGFLILAFVSLKFDYSLSFWAQCLFVDHDWVAWILLVCGGALPVLTGVLYGVDGDGSLLWVPFLTLIVGIVVTFAAMVIATIIVLMIDGMWMYAVLFLIAGMVVATVCGGGVVVVVGIFSPK